MFLIVDDSSIDRMIAKKSLEVHFKNQKVIEVESGKDALEWLQDNAIHHQENIGVLLDIRMPEMNGFDFLDIFTTLSQELKNKVEIIMLSSTLDSKDLERAANHTYVKKLLEKPLDVQLLKKLITF
ncbi:MAG TPA: response regulator [Fulvivirga sp.]|nr:response regulator [Fulvivirga sp.]